MVEVLILGLKKKPLNIKQYNHKFKKGFFLSGIMFHTQIYNLRLQHRHYTTVLHK